MNQRAEEFISDGQPVISVDTKKKELVGNFRNTGRTWRPQGQPEEVNVHDFADKELEMWIEKTAAIAGASLL